MKRVLIALAVVVAACGGAATESVDTVGDQPDPTTAPVATTAPAADEQTATTIAEAAATTVEATTTTEAGGVQFAELSEAQQERIDFLCFAAVVEGDYVGDLEGIRLSILVGELGVPALETVLQALFGEAGIDDEKKFLDGVVPVCEEIGWTP